MGLRGNPDDTRYVQKVKENYDLIDVCKETSEIYPVSQVAVDAESEEIALVYNAGKAEVISFDDFPDGELGVVLEPTVLETAD